MRFSTLHTGTKSGFSDFLYVSSNHLGNVITVVSDRKIGTSLAGTPTILDHYNAEIISSTDYYAFGMPMPGRNYQSSTAYRYGMNGKEKDDEISGGGNSLSFGERQYDSRLGKWFSPDPLAHKFPWQSPYCAFDNNPIAKIDPTGMAAEDFVKDKDGNIKWDKDANSQATTKQGETYLGKDLTLTFNSYIDGKLWDGPDPPKGKAAGDKLTSTIKLKATENENGELTGLTGTREVRLGNTPVGDPRGTYPGKGGGNNVFAQSSINGADGLLSGFGLVFEQHASVSEIEEQGLNALGYKIVDVAQGLTITYGSGQLKIATATGVFPSATLDVRNSNDFWSIGYRVMHYPQPSFKGTHTAPVQMSSFNQPEGRNFNYYPSTLYKR